MATLSATVSFFAVVLFSIVFPAATDDAGADVKPVCAKTPYPEFCESAITVHPESKTAENAQELVYWAVESGIDFALRAHRVANGSTEVCAAACDKNFRWADEDLGVATNWYPAYDDMIKVVNNLLDESKKKKVEWNCDECLGKSAKDAAAITKGNDLEKLMEILPVLAKTK
ncbi:unnamed protein product [Alopecurus aequalis]